MIRACVLRVYRKYCTLLYGFSVPVELREVLHTMYRLSGDYEDGLVTELYLVQNPLASSASDLFHRA